RLTRAGGSLTQPKPHRHRRREEGPMITESNARELLRDAADGLGAHPAPVASVLESGADALTQRNRRRAIATVTGTVAAIALIVGVVAIPKSNDHSEEPVTPPTTTAPADWQHMSGSALADALGLTLIPQAEIKTSAQCKADDGSKKDVVILASDPTTP